MFTIYKYIRSKVKGEPPKLVPAKEPSKEVSPIIKKPAFIANFSRKRFYKELKEGDLLFTNRAGKSFLTVSQVAGMEFILDGWFQRKQRDMRHLAYIMATVYWETGRTFQPIKEQGGQKYLRAKKYWPFYGRGYVQLTWEENYKKMTQLYNKAYNDNVDLVKNPDRAQEPMIARFILFEGMLRGDTGIGDFTNHSLEDFFNDKLTDWENARRIVNGKDKAKPIADIAKIFYNALRLANGEKNNAVGESLLRSR
jgi:putative chitinase